MLRKTVLIRRPFPQIPVFQGSAGPLVGANKALSDHFGSDGLGDVIEDRDPLWKEKIQRERAVDAMIRLVSENHKQVPHLFCILVVWTSS